MGFTFKIIEKENISVVVPFVYKLNDSKIPVEVLEQRFSEMVTQNYECAGIYEGDKIIGVSGMWFCTRHYSGKSVEIDHVYIDDSYRNLGLGKRFLDWISDYVKEKGYEMIELNAYVQNQASHKFYYNQDFIIKGFHFLKKI